jgi:hypothetical protein
MCLLSYKNEFDNRLSFFERIYMTVFQTKIHPIQNPDIAERFMYISYL